MYKRGKNKVFFSPLNFFLILRDKVVESFVDECRDISILLLVIIRNPVKLNGFEIEVGEKIRVL